MDRNHIIIQRCFSCLLSSLWYLWGELNSVHENVYVFRAVLPRSICNTAWVWWLWSRFAKPAVICVCLFSSLSPRDTHLLYSQWLTFSQVLPLLPSRSRLLPHDLILCSYCSFCGSWSISALFVTNACSAGLQKKQVALSLTAGLSEQAAFQTDAEDPCLSICFREEKCKFKPDLEFLSVIRGINKMTEYLQHINSPTNTAPCSLTGNFCNELLHHPLQLCTSTPVYPAPSTPPTWWRIHFG